MKLYIVSVSMLLFLPLSCKREESQPVATTSEVAVVEKDLRVLVIERMIKDTRCPIGEQTLVRALTSTHGHVEGEEPDPTGLKFPKADNDAFVRVVCHPDSGISHVNEETVRDFLRANQSRTVLKPESFGVTHWISMMEEADYIRLMGGLAKGSVAQMVNERPNVRYVVEMSSFGWSRDKAEAIVYIDIFVCSAKGHFSAKGCFYVLRKLNGKFSCDRLSEAGVWMM